MHNDSTNKLKGPYSTINKPRSLLAGASGRGGRGSVLSGNLVHLIPKGWRIVSDEHSSLGILFRCPDS